MTTINSNSFFLLILGHMCKTTLSKAHSTPFDNNGVLVFVRFPLLIFLEPSINRYLQTCKLK